MGFLDFFIKDIETSDNHRNPDLRTHYYRNDYRQTKETLISFLKQKNYTVANIDDNYGEIFVETSSFHVILSLRKASVINTSVDIKVSVYSLIPGYKPHKIVKEIYAHLDRTLQYIGAGNQA